MHAQDGAAIYKQRCEQCHNNPAPHVPSLESIKAMSGAAIQATLTSGPMKMQGAGLSSADVSALIGYIGPTGGSETASSAPARTCESQPRAPGKLDVAQWNGWSTDISNSRYQESAAAGVTAEMVPKLKLKWAFNLGDVTDARSQPAVWGHYLFVGSNSGVFYALNADSGCTAWAFKAASGIRGGASIGEAKGKPAVFFADGQATMYALDAQSGALIWTVKSVDHFASVATTAARYYRGVLYQGFSSFEEVVAGDPKYKCCSFRGSLVALNASTGEKIWHTFTITDPAKPPRQTQRGPSNSVLRARASGRLRPLTSALGFYTWRPEITSRILRCAPATPCSPSISKPVNCFGPPNPSQATCSMTAACSRRPATARPSTDPITILDNRRSCLICTTVREYS